MKIIVVGCGKIGTTILENLVEEGHNVTVVDNRPTALNEVTNIHDVISVCGNGADCETLEEAGAAQADLVVAATGSDEVNMLCGFMAGQMGAANTVARIRNPEYNDRSLATMKQNLSLSMAINPDKLAAHEIYDMLRLPAANKVEAFSGRRFEMIEIRVREGSPFAGLALNELRSQFKAMFLVCVVQRGDQVFIPDGNFVLQTGDKLALTAVRTEIQKLLKALGLSKKQARKVMILGGSRSGYYLAKRLLMAGAEVTMIDKDPVTCETMSELLPGATIICGDGAQQELLLEEGLTDMDAFVALTGLDEQNILLSFFAAANKVPKVIAKANRKELSDLAQQLGLESVISPRDLVADVLVQHARALKNSKGSSVMKLYRLMNDKVEVLEFSVKDDPRLVRIPLKDLQLKPQVLVAGIIRGREIIIPAGDDMILPGDRVVVVTAAQHLQDLADIIK